MTEVILCFKIFYQHVVDIDFHRISELLGEHLVDEPLVSCSRILQLERHDPIAVCSSIYVECRFLVIIRVHHDLVITREGVHEREELFSSSCFDQAVNMR